MAKKKSGGKEVNNEVFVGVRDPVEMRRNVLESTKDVVEILQRFERFRAVREEKIKTIALLKEQIKEITKLMAKVKRDIPNVNVRIRSHEEVAAIEEEVKAKPVKKTAKKKAPKKRVLPKSMHKEANDLEKLEAELTNIEQKLGKI